MNFQRKKKIRLYHYFCENKKHFEEKVNKGMADRNAKEVWMSFIIMIKMM